MPAASGGTAGLSPPPHPISLASRTRDMCVPPGTKGRMGWREEGLVWALTKVGWCRVALKGALRGHFGWGGDRRTPGAVGAV